ncbi:MAG: hypothetical protein NTX03_10215 [Bacteroidetes bacterium]|nr:hypothetical protein [Bacteroidota bacterium]
MLNAKKLQQILLPFLRRDFILQSRIHEAGGYFNQPKRSLFIKREDELSSGICGGKYRKFASLLQHISNNNYDEVYVIGSANSNNVLAAAQLFIEAKIPAKYFLLESHNELPFGNHQFLKILVDDGDISYIKREDWKEVEELCHQEAKASKKKIFVMPEGGAMVEAITGAMTLAVDVCHPERPHPNRWLRRTLQGSPKGEGQECTEVTSELKVLSFGGDLGEANIFIDSGTGTSAIGLILGLSIMQLNPNIHITLIAGNEKEFRTKLELFRKNISVLLKTEIEISAELVFHKPAIAPSFGVVNSSVIKETKAIAQQEGILADPVYSVKHFYTVKKFLEKTQLESPSLIIYNGGSLGLAGFQDLLDS